MHKLKVTPKNNFVSIPTLLFCYPYTYVTFFCHLHNMYDPDYIRHLKKRQYKPGLWTVDGTVGWTQYNELNNWTIVSMFLDASCELEVFVISMLHIIVPIYHNIILFF